MTPSRSTEGVPPMLRSKLVPLAIALLMVLPAVLVLSPAANAQDTVPVASGVRWESQLNHEQRLYLKYPNARAPVTGDELAGRPDCTSTATGSAAGGGAATLELLTPDRRTENVREPCSYVAQVASQSSPAQSQASFTLPAPLRHSFNVTGNTSLMYVHQGRIPEGVTLTLQLRRDGNTISTAQIEGNNNRADDYFKAFFTLGPTAHQEFKAGERIVLTLTGTTASNGAGVPGTVQPSWTLGDKGAYLAVRSADALKAATWTTDEKGDAKSLFRPLARNASGGARLFAFFAVQSAFSIDDARGFPSQSGVRPYFSFEKGGRAIPIGQDAATRLNGEYNVSLSGDADARAVWGFPANMLDYSGFEPGEYNITVDFSYHQGGGFSAGVRSRVLITAQSVTLRPYDDQDPNTLPETNAHDVAPGGTTTYLFVVNNTGSANDTFRIDAGFISGAPAGWAAVVGGPRVTEGRIFLAPQQSDLVTVTVTAPPGASVGSSSIFQVQATSLLDPGAKSLATTVVSTVSNAVARQVQIIAPATDLPIVPGEETRVPLYVWNRGTRFGTMALETRGTLGQDWVFDFVVADSTTSRVVLPSVPAGGVVAVEARAIAPLTLAEGSQSVTLNATQTDASAVATELPIRLVIRPSSAVKVDILHSIAGIEHIAELTGNYTLSPGTGPTGDPVEDPACTGGGFVRGQGEAEGQACLKDGIEGVWFRAWVTNAGRRTEQFDLRLDSKSKPDCDQAFVGEPVIYFRDAKGTPVARDTVLLKPGQTAEFYVWRPIDPNRNDDCSTLNPPREDRYSFVLEAKGRDTGVIGRAGTTVLAVDNSGSDYVSPILLEHVARAGGYGVEAPYVDVRNATKRNLPVGIEVNTTQSYFVRLTNGASWSDYEDPFARRTFSPAVKLVVEGVDKDGGWNVSVRRADGDTNTVTNPWVDTLTFSNQFPTAPAGMRRQGWADYEVEVRIQAPRGENGTGLAGDQDQFTLQASLGDKRSTLDFKAVITEFANVSIEADSLNVLAHPGQAGAALVYVNNTGSSAATVSLRAAVHSSTPNAAAWTIEPAVQTFVLEAFRNRTAALLITPPGGAASGDVVVTVEYAPNPLDPTLTRNKTLQLSTQVVPRGTLTLAASTTDVTIAPGGFANYTLNLVNTGTLPVTYNVAATSIPNWTATLSPLSGNIAAGETRAIVYVLKAPTDVTNGSRFSSIVKVEENGNVQNFDIRPVTVSILGGKALPSVSVPKVQKTVDRNGLTHFEVIVKNLGSAAGRIDVSARSQDASWLVGVQNARGDAITSLNLAPNDLVTLNVTVRAPFTVAENTVVPIEFLAEGGGVAAKQTLQAVVHDYGVSLGVKPAQVDAAPGVPTELILTLRNTGNDNDTLNVSANLVDLPEWRVDLSLERIRLEPGQSTDVRAIVRPPTSPLPTPRAYSIKFFAGTVGGVAVNIPKNESVTAVVNVLNYRPMDIDRDDRLEVAVDADRNPANGFEKFQEIFTDGVTSTVVAMGRLDGKARFFLDVPRDRPVDGVADVWFDPEQVYAYDIRYAPDINNDNSPDYFLDVNRDGKVDRAFDAVTQSYWGVTEVKAYGDERVQFLVDLGNDNRPDRFYDPDQDVVTRTYTVDGQTDAVGLDTNNDGRVDKVYDLKTSSVSDARLSGATSFFGKYWYFFVGFAILLLVSILLIVRRRRA